MVSLRRLLDPRSKSLLYQVICLLCVLSMCLGPGAAGASAPVSPAALLQGASASGSVGQPVGTAMGGQIVSVPVGPALAADLAAQATIAPVSTSTPTPVATGTPDLLPSSTSVDTAPTATPTVSATPATPTPTATPIVTATIDPELGGVFQSSDKKLTITFPAGATTERLSVTAKQKPILVHGDRRIVHWYEVNAFAADRDNAPVHLFDKDVEIVIRYTDEEMRGLNAAATMLYSFDEATGKWILMPSKVDLVARTVTGTVNHFSDVSSQTDPNISGPGQLMAVQNDLHSGAATASYPIEVPPGPGGLQPNIALNYNSGRADDMRSNRSTGSWVGIGWSLGLGRVSYDAVQNRYTLDMNGQGHILMQDGSGAWHTQYESFYRIKFENNVWKVWDKSGTYYEFGGGAGDRQYYKEWTGGGYSTHPYRWDLNLIKDVHENSVTISNTQYLNADCSGSWCEDYVRAAYPTDIYYGATSAQYPKGRVHISLAAAYNYTDTLLGTIRLDDPRNGVLVAAPKVMETRYLDYIDVRVDNALVRRYDLSYGFSEGNCGGDICYSGAITLSSITQYGTDGTTALPTTSYTYQSLGVHYWYNISPPYGYEFRWPHLTRVENGYGGVVNFGYFEAPPQSPTLPYLTWSRQVVLTQTLTPGVGPVVTTTYQYWDYDGHQNDPAYYVPGTGSSTNWYDAEYRGFNQILVNNPDGTRVYHRFFTTYDSDTDSAINPMPFATTAEVFSGREYRTEYRDTYGTALRTVVNTYQATAVYGWIFFVYLQQTEDTLGTSRTSTKYAYSASLQNGTQYGNLTDVYEYGSADPGGTGWYRHTQTLYRPKYDATNNIYILDKPAKTTVYANNGSGGDGAWQSSTQYLYDGNTTWDATPVSKGDLTAERKALDDYSFADTRYGYDTYGNRTSVTDSPGYGSTSGFGTPAYTTTIQYDTVYRAFPLTTTNALGQVEAKTVDPATGLVLTQTQPNGGVLRYTYDVLKRLTEVRSPTEAQGNAATVKYTYDLYSTYYRIKTEKRQDDGGGATADYVTSYKFYDGVGRLIQSYADAEEANKVVVSNVHYDSMGRKSWESVPRAITAATAFNSTEWNYTNKGRTQYSYDVLGRTTTITNADDTVITTGYSGWTSWTIDQSGHKKEYVNDAYGRLSYVKEYTGTNPSFTLYATTSYAYNLRNGLTGVTDAASNVTQISYDKLGRKTEMVDPDMGHWYYGYDAKGLLRWQEDAKGQMLFFFYDALGRMVRKASPFCTALATYEYDQQSPNPSYAVGSRTAMTDTSGTTRWDYDIKGRLVKERKTIDGAPYTTLFSYNAMDQVKTITYPGDNEVVTNTYNNAGLLGSVSSSLTSNLVSSVAHNAQGQIKSLSLNGGSIATTFGYYGYIAAGISESSADHSGANKSRLGQLWDVKTTKTGAILQDLRYDYDSVGNVVNTTDLTASPTGQAGAFNYTYDPLDRLLTATPMTTSTVQTAESWVYSTVGNIITATRGAIVRGYAYGDDSHKHAVTAVATQTFTYDANGNMTAGRGQSIQWDVENRPVVITDSSGVPTTYTYDGDGKLVKKVVNGSTTRYVGNYYEETGSSATKYYYADGRRVAMRNSSGLYYFLADNLGGTYATVDSSGNNQQTSPYYAYGERRGATTIRTDKLYTGQELEAGSGLYYYGARFYDPTIGRFISADTIVPNQKNPQSLNRYAYCLNNPVNNTDPTGHFSPDEISRMLFEMYGEAWSKYMEAFLLDDSFFRMLIDAREDDWLVSGFGEGQFVKTTGRDGKNTYDFAGVGGKKLHEFQKDAVYYLGPNQISRYAVVNNEVTTRGVGDHPLFWYGEDTVCLDQNYVIRAEYALQISVSMDPNSGQVTDWIFQNAQWAPPGPIKVAGYATWLAAWVGSNLQFNRQLTVKYVPRSLDRNPQSRLPLCGRTILSQPGGYP